MSYIIKKRTVKIPNLAQDCIDGSQNGKSSFFIVLLVPDIGWARSIFGLTSISSPLNYQDIREINYFQEKIKLVYVTYRRRDQTWPRGNIKRFSTF